MSRGLALKVPTDWDISVAMETVSPVSPCHPCVSPGRLLVCVCLSPLSLQYNIGVEKYSNCYKSWNTQMYLLQNCRTETAWWTALRHLQETSGTLHFSTRRHRTSTSPPFTASWVRTSPFCLKPPQPQESSWKTWASETSSGSNWAVSKTLWVRCLIWTSLWCDTSWVRKDHPGNERFNSAGSVFSVWESTSVHLNPWEISLLQQHCHLLFLHWEITAASLL